MAEGVVADSDASAENGPRDVRQFCNPAVVPHELVTVESEEQDRRLVGQTGPLRDEFGGLQALDAFVGSLLAPAEDDGRDVLDGHYS